MNANFTLFGLGVMSDGNERYEHELIIVYVPTDSEFQNVEIIDDSGEVICGNFYAEKLKIEADYGDVELEKVGSQNTNISMDSGNLQIASSADGDITVENDYGDVELENEKEKIAVFCESGNIQIEGVK